MGKTRGLFQKIKSSSSESESSDLSPEVILRGGKGSVKGIACVSNHDLIAISYSSKKVYIYDYSTQGEPVRVFEAHKGNVCGLVHLCEDVLASVDRNGVLLTWRATTGVILSQLQVSDSACTGVTKANSTEIYVPARNGQLALVKHTDGRNLAVRKRCPIEFNSEISDTDTYKHILATVGLYTAQICRRYDGNLVHTIEFTKYTFQSIALSEEFVVIGRRDFKIDVHRIDNGYKLVRTIDLCQFHSSERVSNPVNQISFLSADIVMATTEYAGLFFISLQSAECVSHCQMDNSRDLFRATILSDGWICVGGQRGYCAIFKPPQELVDIIAEYLQRLHISRVAPVPFLSPPLKHIYDAVHDDAVSVPHAVDFVVLSKYHCESIKEWTYAHFIVMGAVKSGDIPHFPEFNDDPMFWWNHLYKEASSIEMGEDDRRLVLKFIIEAEVAGILSGGCAEIFEEAGEMRSEEDMLSTTMIDLYTRQIATHEKVRRILRVVKAHRATLFVGTLLSCILLGGDAAVRVLSGGLAVLDDAEEFNLSELLEFLFGQGKDWSSFISDLFVERFLQAADVVLEENTWTEIPEVRRREIQAAANGMGRSIGELRRRLRSAAQEVEVSAPVTAADGLGIALQEMRRRLRAFGLDTAAPSAIVAEEVDESDTSRKEVGDVSAAITNRTRKSSSLNVSTSLNSEDTSFGKLPFSRNPDEESFGRLPSNFADGHDNPEVWKAIKILQLKIQAERTRREILEIRTKEQEEKIDAMTFRIHSLESTVSKLRRKSGKLSAPFTR